MSPLLLAPLLLAQLSLRGGEPAPPGRIARLDPAGVFIAGGPETAGDTPTLVVTWDRVRAIDGPFAQRAAPFLQTADSLWRARTRLERGDTPAAERLFESLFLASRATPSPTSAVVSEGLLRCRLRRGAHVLAIEPWLALLDARDASTLPRLHEHWAQEAGLPAILDDATGLVPALPPIWVAWPSMMAFANGSEPPTPTSSRAATLGALYLAAARAEVGRAGPLPRVPASDPGAQLVWNILAARAGDPEQRENARKSLRERTRSWPGGGPTPAWAVAWCRAAIGRSLLLEPNLDRRQAGLIELLSIPAELASAHPYLSGLALAESAATLHALGDRTAATTLATELALRYPGHPALDWDMIRPLQRAPESTPAPNASSPKEPLP